MESDLQRIRASQELMRAQNQITGFRAPEYLEKKFREIREDLFIVFDPFVGDGYHDNELGRFLELINAIENGLYASLYHLQSVEQMEMAIKDIAIAIFREIPVPDNRTGSIGGGDTRQLDYEYQAFHFALRRTLEYLAQLVAYTFGIKIGSFRELAKKVQNRDPTKLSLRVVDCHKVIMQDCTDLIGPRSNGRQTIRDQIAHYDSVDFGCLNVAWYGGSLKVFFSGGGHKTGPDTKASLSAILGQDVKKVEGAIFEMLSAMDFPSTAFIK